LKRQEEKHAAFRAISACVRQLDKLAGDLESVGNTFLMQRVDKITSRLADAVNTLDRIDANDLADYMKQTNASSYNMLQACLAGAELGKQSK